MSSALRIFQPEPLPDAARRRDMSTFFGNATDVLAVLIGFSIPVSTSLAEIATSLFVLCWLLSGDWSGRTRLIAGNPVAKLALALFGLLLVATVWSTATWPSAFRCLLKYRELVFLALLIPVFQDARLRTWGMRGFMAGAAGMLALSYFEWLSGFDLGMASDDNNFVIAKDRIIHSMLISLAAYFSAQELLLGGRGRWFHAAVLALAIPNVVFLVPGRTGFLLLGVLTLLVMAQQFGRRGVVGGLVLVSAVACGAYMLSFPVRHRVAQTISQLRNQFTYPRQSSEDARLEFYENTLALIKRHPVLGTGTGSFKGEYAQRASLMGVKHTDDPHNEYLHLAVQTGLPGLGLFLALLITQWRTTGNLPERESRIAQGTVAAIAAGCLFNSLILSVTGGLVWSYFSALATASSATPPTRQVQPDVTVLDRKAA